VGCDVGLIVGCAVGDVVGAGDDTKLTDISSIHKE
jgi:hypothetical protein